MTTENRLWLWIAGAALAAGLLAPAPASAQVGVTLRTRNAGGVSTPRIQVQTNVDVARVTYVNSFAGFTPMAAPASPAAGDVYYDTASNTLRYHNGTAWVPLGAAGSGITSLNLQTGVSQTFINDTNVTITSGSDNHTLGWLGSLAATRGGTGIAGAGGTANRVLLTTTGATWTAGQVDLSTGQVAATLPIARGGTGATSVPANGQLLIGNGAGYAVATLTQGTAIGITNAAGSITINNTGDTNAADDLTSIPVQNGAGATQFTLLPGTGDIEFAQGANMTLTFDAPNRRITFDASGGLTGGGTVNYVSRWTGATSLGDSTIQDNGTTTALGAAPDAASRLYATSALSNTGRFVNTGTAGGERALFGNATGAGASNVGVYGLNDANGVGDKLGVLGNSTGPNGTNYGVQGLASGAATNYGLFGTVGGNPGAGVRGEFNGTRYGYLGGTYGAYAQFDANFYGAMGYDGTWANYMYMNEPDAAADGRTALYAFRERVVQNDGTGWTDTTCNTAVTGNNWWGDQWTAGVLGYNFGDLGMTAGVAGFNETGASTGWLAFRDNQATPQTYGVMASQSGTFMQFGGGAGGALTGDAIGVAGVALNTTGDRYGGYFLADDGAGGWYYAAVAAWDTVSTQNYKIIGTGLVSTIMETRDGPRILYAPEAPEPWFQEYGSGRLQAGHARIQLDPLFLDCITVNEDYPLRVLVQPTGDALGWLQVIKHDDGFEVVDTGGESEAEFDWFVVAKWRGMEGVRMPRSTLLEQIVGTAAAEAAPRTRRRKEP